MIKELDIIQYRKLKDIKFEFSPNINIISGTNGTCKTSILYLISNSFKSFNKKERLKNPNGIKIIKALNKEFNPKIETLTRGDKEYNDPALNLKGSLLTAKFFDDTELNFRRHNTQKENLKNQMKHRFALKPRYAKGTKDTLIPLPVFYLGLFRLFSFGELQDEEKLEEIKPKLPSEYISEIKEIYKDFTNMEIEYKTSISMSKIKNRSEFATLEKGIDSNTISAGEDNLLIILTALISLKYHFENLVSSTQEIESILLIDEIDATLHPEYQIKLLDLFNKFSKDYKIQIFFTTHSISLLSYAFRLKNKVFYLLDNISRVALLEEPNIYKIDMFLKNKTRNDINQTKNIPIFTEDKEARLFLRKIFEYFSADEEFKKVKNLFYLVDISISCNDLKKFFTDDEILKSTSGNICILDGDAQKLKNFSNRIITLPSDKPIEKIVFEYSEHLFKINETTNFWKQPILENNGISVRYYATTIKNEINNRRKTSEKKERDLNKAIFNKYITFFEKVIEEWLNDASNKKELERFYNDLKITFKKVALFNNIDPNEWK